MEISGGPNKLKRPKSCPDKKKNTTSTTDKTEIKTENSNPEADNSENASGLENHEINPWHTLLEKSSSYERLSRLDPATKPWV